MKNNSRQFIALIFFVALAGLMFSCQPKQKIVWQMGKADNSAAEFALAPDEYARFLEKDFGWEDKFYLIGLFHVKRKTGLTFYLVRQMEWGGTSGTAGWRSHVLNILFGLDKAPKNGAWSLTVNILDYQKEDPPLFKVTANGESWKFSLPKGSGNKIPQATTADSSGIVLEIPLPVGLLKERRK